MSPQGVTITPIPCCPCRGAENIVGLGLDVGEVVGLLVGDIVGSGVGDIVGFGASFVWVAINLAPILAASNDIAISAMITFICIINYQLSSVLLL
jgi:hypothetical protein